MNVKFTQLPADALLPVQGVWLLVHGEEEYLKRQVVERLRAQLLPAEDAFNLEQIDLAERGDEGRARVEQILTCAQALPFLGSGRLVIVRNLDLLPTEGQKKLAAAFATAPPTNHVVLVTGEAGAGKKAPKLQVDLQRALDRQGTIYDCSALSPDEAAAWVQTTVAADGLTIESGARSLLVTRAGTELRRLQIELEKLILLVGPGGRIRVGDVDSMTPKLAEESVFSLADAVAARDGVRALAVLRDLVEGQLESPMRLFPLLVRQFRLIWQTKVLLETGWTPRQDPAQFPAAVALLPTQAALGQLGGWLGTKLAAQARQFSWESLELAYQALLECDMASKAIDGVPRLEMEIALELLCAKLCAPRPRGR
jgi:DNA polymerase-3 subunit delta